MNTRAKAEDAIRAAFLAVAEATPDANKSTAEQDEKVANAIFNLGLAVLDNWNHLTRSEPSQPPKGTDAQPPEENAATGLETRNRKDLAMGEKLLYYLIEWECPRDIPDCLWEEKYNYSRAAPERDMQDACRECWLKAASREWLELEPETASSATETPEPISDDCILCGSPTNIPRENALFDPAHKDGPYCEACFIFWAKAQWGADLAEREHPASAKA